MKILIIFLVILTLNLYEVNSLQCYQCSNKHNAACGDPFDAEDTLQDCPKLGGLEALMCRKLRQTVDTPIGKFIRVTRNCGYTKDDQSERDTSCFRASFTTGSSSKYCACTDSSCNSGETIRMSSLMIMSLLIAIFTLNI